MIRRPAPRLSGPTRCSGGCKRGAVCALCAFLLEASAWHAWNDADDLRVVER